MLELQRYIDFKTTIVSQCSKIVFFTMSKQRFTKTSHIPHYSDFVSTLRKVIFRC